MTFVVVGANVYLLQQQFPSIYNVSLIFFFNNMVLYGLSIELLTENYCLF